MYYTSPSLLLPVAALILAIVSLVVLNGARRKRPVGRFPSWLSPLPRNRASESSQTSPRSMTPEKKTAASTSHKNMFPPSTRENLAKAATNISAAEKLQGARINEAEFEKNLIPFTANYKHCGPSAYTPMGLTVEEVESLGDFPNYSALSGVPLPNLYNEFDINRAIARPYRPFRWAYHQTMSLSNLESDWWLELEKTYVERIAERKELYQKHGKLVLQYLPGSELGCKEVMEHALQFLCARYPQHFSLSHNPTSGYVFHNGLLKNETIIKAMHPLYVLLENVPEDFAVMVRNPEDGMYYFRAGLLCSSLGWNVDTKIGKVLRAIHEPIPDYMSKMAMSMDRYFSKMPASKPIQRGSWGLEVDTPLFMPPGDPHGELRDYQLEDLTLDRVHLRVDWQTLRRLPISGSIIFNFKALFTPIEEFRTEPGVPAVLAKVLREGKESIMKYKDTWHVEHVALPALEKWAGEQARGEVEGLEYLRKGPVGDGVEGQEAKGEGMEGGSEWEVRTLDETPFFRGWKEKWHRQQGF